MGTNDIGVVGLAVMGRNLVLNMAGHGFAVAAFNRTSSVTREFAATVAPEHRVLSCYSPEELVASLAKPRRVLLMVKAGPPVDEVIASIRGLLSPGDVLMDGGNSHFRDTERRAGLLADDGILYVGLGISGGEYGARHGPSLMPGGPREAYDMVEPILTEIAARVDGAPCVAYLGKGAAGHYTKMVHNGIEYGVMQLIAESYALLKQVFGLSNDQLAGLYRDWSRGDLDSYLMEITARIFERRDEKTGGYLVDVIRGEAGQLGTGSWASQSAMELQVPVPNVDVAVAMRGLSALVGQGQAERPGGRARDRLGRTHDVDLVRDALYAAMAITYAQGFAQLSAASVALGYGLRLEDVASIWRGGCIIRARLLGDIEAAFHRQPDLSNLLLDPRLSAEVQGRREALARMAQTGISAGVPVPGLTAALGYLDAYQSDWLPFNLIQAQRDYFGAHGYQRTDEVGWFHTEWLAGQEGS